MPFVFNAWYVAALPEELDGVPLGRGLGNSAGLVPPARWRSGGPGRRFAALSNGQIRDGNLQCPYHGLEFDGSGRCIHNPHGNGARPEALNVRSFPTVERDELIWVWPGDPSLADTAAIPDFSCRSNPAAGRLCKRKRPAPVNACL